jgi:hypothetical protein
MGLVTAVFLIVIVGMFGVLIARYATVSSVASAETFIWTQALSSAESTARLNILRHDGGGNLAGAVAPVVGGVSTAISSDSFTAPAIPATIRVRGFREVNGSEVSRTVEVKFQL